LPRRFGQLPQHLDRSAAVPELQGVRTPAGRSAWQAAQVARMALVKEMMTMVWSRSLCVLFAMIGASASSWAQGAKVITYDEWSAIESAQGRCERALAWHKEK
jgi:hypothetical protein